MSIDGPKLIHELKALRRDEGRTLAKLLGSPQIRAALGNPREAGLVEAFDAAIAGLGTDRRALALKNAYAINVRSSETLTKRREAYGALAAINRSPDTVKDWEDEQIDALAARFLAGDSAPQADNLMVAVAVAGGRIMVVAEGQAEAGSPMRQWHNPNPEPFWPGFICVVPPFYRPSRLTVAVGFLDNRPSRVTSEAAGDLLAFVCGDGHLELEIAEGGVLDIEATAMLWFTGADQSPASNTASCGSGHQSMSSTRPAYDRHRGCGSYRSGPYGWAVVSPARGAAAVQALDLNRLERSPNLDRQDVTHHRCD